MPECTHIFSLEPSTFNFHVELQGDTHELHTYLDISSEYQLMTFDEAHACALHPPNSAQPTVVVGPTRDVVTTTQSHSHHPIKTSSQRLVKCKRFAYFPSSPEKKDQLAQLFATLLQLHPNVSDLNCAILEREDSILLTLDAPSSPPTMHPGVCTH